MKSSKIFIVTSIVLFIVVIVLSVLCVKQHNSILRNKVENLNVAFYYMQETLEEEMDNEFKNWDDKAAKIYMLQEHTTTRADNLGDYEKISNLILKISQIENPKQKEAVKLIDVARKMRVSWSIGDGDFGVNIIQ